MVGLLAVDEVEFAEGVGVVKEMLLLGVIYASMKIALFLPKPCAIIDSTITVNVAIAVKSASESGCMIDA